MSDLEQELTAMLNTLENKLPENPAALLAELSERCMMLARAGVLYADAEQAYAVAKAPLMDGYIAAKISPMTLRELLSAKLHAEQRVLTLAEKLNSILDKSIRGIITAVSYAKNEMNHLPYSPI